MVLSHFKVTGLQAKSRYTRKMLKKLNETVLKELETEITS